MRLLGTIGPSGPSEHFSMRVGTRGTSHFGIHLGMSPGIGQVTRTLILGLGMVGGLKPPHRKLCRSLRRLRKNRLCSSPRLLKPPSRL